MSKKVHSCRWCRAGWWREDKYAPGGWVWMRVEVPGLPLGQGDLCDKERRRTLLENRRNETTTA